MRIEDLKAMLDSTADGLPACNTINQVAKLAQKGSRIRKFGMPPMLTAFHAAGKLNFDRVADSFAGLLDQVTK